MRRRILTVALSAVVLAVLVLGVPLAVAVGRMVTADEQGELERLALRSAVSVSPSYQQGDPIELPGTEAGVELGVYDAGGHRVSGTGPVSLESSLGNALTGNVIGGRSNGDLVEAVPVSVEEKVIAVVRVASPESALRHRIWWSWLGLAGLALLAAACAFGLAAWQSRRLARPLSALAGAAQEIGDGKFSIRLSPSGVPEIDAGADALNRTSQRLADTMERQRAFNVQASHQLRTPLTHLRLELETALSADDPDRLRTAAESAIASADALEQTIDDVLALARGPAGSEESFDVEALLEECRSQWQGLLASVDRPLRVVVQDSLRAAASLSAARQVLQVLLDNAYRHGSGVVTVRARESAGVVAIDVMDEGTPGSVLPSAGDSQGEGVTRLGLPMARSLALAQGGRLLTAQGPSGTRLTLLLSLVPDA